MARSPEKPKEGMGARVERERTKRGWSQEKLAEILSISRSAIKSKELGERPFSLEEANTLCECFHMTLDELVNGVRTENVSIHDALGLDDAAINTIRYFNERNAHLDGLSKALASHEVLKAISLFMDHAVEKKGLYLSSNIQRKGSFEECTMSQEFMERVLQQQVVEAFREAKCGENTHSYFSALEDFEPYAEKDQKLAEPSDYMGVKGNGEET